METLREHQVLFASLVPKLIERIFADGYECTLGEAERSPEWAKALAARGKGIARSLHTQRLAIDLHLFKDGKYLSATKHHAPFGAFWESLHPLARWGGRFADGNHYSITYGGRA